MAVFDQLDQAFIIDGITTSDVKVEITLQSYDGPEASGRYWYDGRYPTGSGTDTRLKQDANSDSFYGPGVSAIALDGSGRSTLASVTVSAGSVFSFVVSGHAGSLVLLNNWTLNAPVNCEATAVTIKSSDGATTLHTYDISAGVNGAVTDTTGSIDGELVGFVAAGPDYTQRKGSTFDVTHGLGTITTATLNGNAVTVNTTGAGTVNLTDSSGIVTSGEYDLVLGDGTGTETYTVQLNVIGLPSFNINKDGADQTSLADVEFIALSGAAGSRAVVDQVSDITTDANGDTGPIEFTELSLGIGDTVLIAQQSPTAAGGAIHSATLEAI